MRVSSRFLRLLQTIIIVLPITVFAQISGNQIYENKNNSYNNRGYALSTKKSITVGTSELIVSSVVMANIEPDVLLITLGVNHEAKTVKECSEGINKRIEGFLGKIKTLGIKEDDSYVDFISQTRVYDYNITETKATQFDNGFEIKKNIIIKLTNAKDLDDLITLASGYAIYDIVKAEYIKEDTEAVNEMLFAEALKIINRKKEKHTKVFNVSVSDEPVTVEYNYYSVMPKNQYKEYKAFETSDVNIYNYNYDKNYIEKEQRKNRTFYYEGMDASNFDKIINPSTPQVCLQYVIEVKVVYHIKR
ncbi:SIMPL domain-containing protein [Flavobacterium sp. LaA7.5]|nr:SIMPL domain-containing protein [Flavobacterium salilacus subsp. altitudinum]